MPPSPETKLVVGAVIVDSIASPTKVLGARRSSGRSGAGLWEFPGGKVEKGETPASALQRELWEELSIAARIVDALGADRPIDEGLALRLFVAVTSDVPIRGRDHDEVRWFTADALQGVTWLPADAAALRDVDVLLRRR